MRGLPALIMVALLASASACAGNAPVVGSGPRYGNDWFEVQVENGTTTTLRVFALDATGETPLGRVDALSESTLRVPAFGTSTIQLVARPSVDLLPDRVHRSEPVALNHGQRIVWQLRASPGVSDVPRFSTIRVLACEAERGC
jgi:hypothetical protein